MKKLLAMLVAVVGFMPFVNALAETSTNFYAYDKGDIVNFYGSEEQRTAHQEANGAGGIETIIFNDKGATDEYVQAWLLGEPTGTSIGNVNLLRKPFKETDAYAHYRETMQSNGILPATGAEHYDYIYDIDSTEKGLRLPSIQDMIDVFGAVKTDGQEEYTFPHLSDKTLKDRNGQPQSLLDEFDRLYQEYSSVGLEGYTNGILLSDRKNVTADTNASDHEGAMYYVVKLTITNNKVTGAKIVAEEWDPSSSALYAIIPVVYVNKTADCHKVSKSCYVCGTTYKFVVDGTEGEGCEVVPGVTREEDCYKNVCYKCKSATKEGEFEYSIGKSGLDQYAECEIVDEVNCNSKTGKRSYILEFSIVAALCTISLLVVKRKELFKTI